VSAMLRLGLLLAGVIVAADQATKWWVLAEFLDNPRVVLVTDFFNLVLVWNRGVSFGLFASSAEWMPYILSGLAIVISVFLVIWIRKAENRLLAAGLGFVLGGAIGNVIDRISHKAVVDFLDFHAFGYHWPAFNVADSAIFVGVALILYDGLFENRRKSV
jgi:signal peptidase II